MLIGGKREREEKKSGSSSKVRKKSHTASELENFIQFQPDLALWVLKHRFSFLEVIQLCLASVKIFRFCRDRGWFSFIFAQGVSREEVRKALLMVLNEHRHGAKSKKLHLTNYIVMSLLERLVKNANDKYLLQWAAREGDPILIRVILQEPGLDVNVAVEEAVNAGKVESLNLLLKDPRWDWRQTPRILNVAVSNNDVEIIKLIVESKRFNPYYGLKRAVLDGNTKLVKTFLKDLHVNPIDSVEGNMLLYIASEQGFIEIVNLLLQDPRVDPSADDNTALFEAVQANQSDVVKLLLSDRRVDPTVKDNFVLMEAAYQDFDEVMEILLKDGRADPTARDGQALIYAIEQDNPLIVYLLLEDGRVDPTMNDNFALKKAVAYGHLDIIRLLRNDKRVNPKTFI